MKIIAILYFLTALSSMCMASELTNKELENIYACERVNTGIAIYKTSVSELCSIIEKAGVKTSVSLYDSNLTIKLDIPTNNILIELQAIDSKKLASEDINCYEPMKVTVGNGETLSRAEGTLSPLSPVMLYAFTGLLPKVSQKDIVYKSKKHERTHLGQIYKYTSKVAQEQKMKNLYKKVGDVK